jgi:hypothetical protein
VTEDLHAIRSLLGDLTTRRNPYTRPGAEPSGHPAMRPDQLAEAMRAAAGAFEAIAASNAMTIRVLHSAGLLYTPGKLLPAGEPNTPAATLTTTFTRTSVPATRHQVTAILSSYRAVHSGHSLDIPHVVHEARYTATDGPGPGL